MKNTLKYDDSLDMIRCVDEENGVSFVPLPFPAFFDWSLTMIKMWGSWRPARVIDQSHYNEERRYLILINCGGRAVFREYRIVFEEENYYLEYVLPEYLLRKAMRWSYIDFEDEAGRLPRFGERQNG